MTLFPDVITVRRINGSTDPVTGVFTEASVTVIQNRACDAQVIESKPHILGFSDEIIIIRVFMSADVRQSVDGREAVSGIKIGDSAEIEQHGIVGAVFGEILEIDNVDGTLLIGIK